MSIFLCGLACALFTVLGVYCYMMRYVPSVTLKMRGIWWLGQNTCFVFMVVMLSITMSLFFAA